MSWKYYVVIPEVDLYCDVVGILWALYLKLLCGEMLGIWMVLYVWRDVMQVYSVEPEILM